MDFLIKEINKKYAKFLVIGISVNSPLFLLHEVKEKINLREGDIIVFDQLLQTGDAENRFISLTFGSEDFDLNTAKHIEKSIIDDEVKSIIADFLRNNSMVLKYSILLDEQKGIILDGGFI